MPWHQTMMKDVVNCEKLRRAVSELRPGDIRMGQPGSVRTESFWYRIHIYQEINPLN